MWTTDQCFRLAAERKLLERYLPQFQFHDLSGRTYIQGWQPTNIGRNYLLRLVLPPRYPDEKPDLLVIQPNPLYRWASGQWTASWDLSHGTHTLGLSPDGFVRICHELQWHLAKTCIGVFRKGIIWLAAYEAHLRTGRPPADFIDPD